MSRGLLLLYSWIIGCSTFFHIAAADSSSLFQAIIEDNLQEVAAAISSEVSLDQLDPYGGTPLHLAVHKGNLAMVKLLLDKGADVNAMANRRRQSLLTDKTLKRLKPLFIQAGVTIRAWEPHLFPDSEKEKFPYYSCYHGTPLHIAAYQGNMEMVALLIAYGAILNSHSWDDPKKPHPGNHHDATPLMVAVRRGHTTLVAWLLQKGAPVNDSDERGFTALYYALPRGLHMVQLLIAHGAYVNATTAYGNVLSFVHEAPAAERKQIMQLLLKKGTRNLYALRSSAKKDTIAYLLEQGASLHHKDKEGNTPLYAAIQQTEMRRYNITCLDLRKSLDKINNNVQQDSFDIVNKRKLWQAILGGDLEEIKQMITSSDIPINQSCQKGYVPLHMEIQMGHLQHFDDKIRIIHGYTPLHLAAYRGHVALIKFLLTKGADINAIDEQYGYTPLHLAVYQGDEKVVKLLIKHKALIDIKEQLLGRTVLHLAAATGNSASIQYLIKHGATLHSVDKNQWTAVHVAIAANNAKEVIQLLISKGELAAYKTLQRDTLLHFAAKEKDIDSVGYLIQKGADVNATNAAGKTPLHYMVKQHIMEGPTLLVEADAIIEGCKLLVEAGADINMADKKGRTPLYAACRYGYQKGCIDFLIQKGAEIHICNKKGHTPLHWVTHSIRTQSLETIKTLHRCGADINALDYEGNTPLHLTIIANVQSGGWMNSRIIEYLISHGSNLKHKNKNGQTPLDLVIHPRQGNKRYTNEIITLLKPN